MVEQIIFAPIRCPYCGTNVVVEKGIVYKTATSSPSGAVHCTGCSKSFNAWGL